LELARTELLYGEWLRRQRQKVDARVHLRAALAVFERLDASPWAERTRSELQASGQTVGCHLHKLYAKLGIASRADLRQLEQNDGHDGG
jgi:hypothetical protein